jgi:hypothetical protein
VAALAKRIVSLLTTSALTIALLAPPVSAADPEGEILSLMNAARAGAGLSPVTLHSDLIDDALDWSQQMEQDGTLSHNPDLSSVTTDWDKLGENVGVGTSAQALHDAFMASSSHRGNILGDYDYVGIAVVEETPTKLWVTVVFMKALNSAPTEPVSDQPAPTPYAKEQPEPAPQQPEPADQEATPTVTEPETPRPVPEDEIIPFETTATLVFLG